MRLAALLLAALLTATPLAAQDGGLAAARAAGLVGERYDGYLGLSRTAADATRRQVAAINIKRRALYTDLAQRKGVSREEVGVTAACQLLARVAVGEAYLMADNVWRRRAAGSGPPRPDYCG